MNRFEKIKKTISDYLENIPPRELYPMVIITVIGVGLALLSCIHSLDRLRAQINWDIKGGFDPIEYLSDAIWSLKIQFQIAVGITVIPISLYTRKFLNWIIAYIASLYIIFLHVWWYLKSTELARKYGENQWVIPFKYDLYWSNILNSFLMIIIMVLLLWELLIIIEIIKYVKKCSLGYLVQENKTSNTII